MNGGQLRQEYDGLSDHTCESTQGMIYDYDTMRYSATFCMEYGNDSSIKASKTEKMNMCQWKPRLAIRQPGGILYYYFVTYRQPNPGEAGSFYFFCFIWNGA